MFVILGIDMHCTINAWDAVLKHLCLNYLGYLRGKVLLCNNPTVFVTTAKPMLLASESENKYISSSFEVCFSNMMLTIDRTTTLAFTLSAQKNSALRPCMR